MGETPARVGPSELDQLPEAEARRLLLTCCASDEWASSVLAGRPYGSEDRLLDGVERACRELSDAGLEQALSAHPRIGERPGARGAEADLSRREQSAVSRAGADVKHRLREANVAYEERFGRVFLIRAAGREPEEVLTEARRRLDNDPATERGEVVEQLAQITRRRVEGMVDR